MPLNNIFIRLKHKHRNASKAKLIGDFLNQSKTIVDVETGSGSRFQKENHSPGRCVSLLGNETFILVMDSLVNMEFKGHTSYQ